MWIIDETGHRVVDVAASSIATDEAGTKKEIRQGRPQEKMSGQPPGIQTQGAGRSGPHDYYKQALAEGGSGVLAVREICIC